MSEQFASLSEIINADGTQYDTVNAHGMQVRLGSLSSADMIEWIEMQMKPDTKHFAGIYLLVMSLVGANGERVPKEERAAVVEVFKGKDARENRKIIKKARELNGLEDLFKTLEALKNASSGASTDASPTDSPSPSGE